MAMSDPIADMLVRIKNAGRVGHEKVNIPSSRVKSEIATMLKEEGYIRNFKIIKDRKQGILRVYLKYYGDRNNVISGTKRISKPGCRVFVGKDDIPAALDGMGVVILSTNQGIMTDSQCREKKIGGEVICAVW